MPDILQAAATFRAELVRQERAAASRMVAYYSEVWNSLRSQIDALTSQMQAARDRGERVSQIWLFRMDRLQSLERQVQSEIGSFARFAGMGITALQSDAVQLGQAQAQQLILNGLESLTIGEPTVSLSRLPTEAVTDLVGFLSDGSPLAALLDQLPNLAGSAVKKALVRAVALGTAPRVVGHELKEELGGNLTRVRLISRTEMMRSFRSASIRTYQANDRVVQGWIWTCSWSARTCAMCVSMHGSEHPLDEDFASHPNCRCSPVPFLRRAELNEEIEPGEERFAKETPQFQEAVLGPAKYRAYQAGEITLKDTVGYRKDPKWGPERWERSLKSILKSR